ncbi:MAG: DNA-3-methyladenine glycosylase family protein, partial [Gaiellaceae bacterium]
MLVEIPQPYDFELSTARFRNFGSDRATVWHEGGLHRVVAGREVRIAPVAGGVSVEPGSPEVAAEIGHLLGLPFDLDAFRSWAAGDAELGAIVEALPGFRPTLSPDPFEALAIAITAQQISLHAAAAIRGNLVERFGVRHDLAWEFPKRERLRRVRPAELTVLGFSRSKADYVLELAHSDLDFDTLAERSDDGVIETLTAVRGLGRWTADWFLARHLARPHAWPAGDLGVRKAVSTFYAAGRQLSIEEVRGMGERFAP